MGKKNRRKKSTPGSVSQYLIHIGVLDIDLNFL